VSSHHHARGPYSRLLSTGHTRLATDSEPRLDCRLSEEWRWWMGSHRSPGGVKTIVLEPKEAYGEADPSLVVDIPMASVRQAIGDIAADGLTLETNILLPDGRSAVVKDISSVSVRVDLNHPLAGQRVEFQLAVMEVSLPGQLLESQKDANTKLATVAHILVEEEALALKLKLELTNGMGADFALLAEEHSTCPSSREGGKLGTFQAGMMVPEFDAVVFDSEMEIGKVHGPVKTQFGWHLIVIEDRTM
jgi:peptidyl-prolyl cis-trans isomerase C